ncbi:putative pentatricopeptide [Rosa chinensis]|uniref:Putative pentatricopeptide n=1 Tax=Rosa chinensis TaxID=74649 RepID=A0A2P6PFZ1_ROSCH|nr:pentatricopeptide repeat-containing protein At1g08070, chloroplastic [Rosa chinensis]XP_040366684.1 pentatricopeptide repeat-containing protein At1g08070, chloroplastic [Rosa chinensis]PRQ20846.1 putative pentatricopeptide [Rosa chinensis]
MRQLNQIHALLVKNPKPQVLNPWLGYLTNSSAPQNALFLYNQMLHHPTSHNHYTFTYALKACCLLHSPHKGQEIQAHVTKSGHISDTFIQNSLLHFYVIQSDIVSATRVFDSIPVPDVVSWTSMISGLSKCGFVEEAIVKFMSMDVKPNSTTLVTVLSSCSTLRALKFGKAVHGHCLRNFRERNLILDNAVLDFYLRCGSLASARYLFVNMPKRDVVSWTIMVGGYAQRGFCEEAVKLFQQLLQGGEAEPNEATIVNVLSACSSICALSSGQQVHSYISTRRDLTANGNVGNALVNMYVKCGNLGMAISVFQSLEHKDIISWSTIICGMAMNGHGIHLLQLFSSMLVNGVSPDGVTFLGLLSACSHAGLVNQGLMFFNAMKKVYRIVPETQHYACLVDMYGRAGLLEEAEAFIKEMPTEADGPVWGALLNACKIYGNEEMVERIREGLRNSAGVSTGTYALLSNAYAKHDRWDDSNKVRDEMREMGLKAPPGRSWIEIGPSI